MNRLFRLVRARPDLSVALGLLLAAVVFFSAALWPPEGQVLAGHDMLAYYYGAWDAVREGLRAGQLVLWEPEIFVGFPFLAQPQQNTFYPPNWINLLVPTRVGVTWLMAFHVWLAGFGLYLFARRMGARRLPALLGGLGFAYGGLLAGRLWAGHSPVYAVFVWTPLLLAALVWAVERRGWAAAVVAGAPFGLAILAGHIPSFLYVGMIWAAFVVYLWLTRPGARWVVARAALVSAAVGLALAAVQLVPFLQFSLVSGRVASADYVFATDYSFPPAHLITLLVPEFFGEPLRVGYWSVPTFEELTYYAGGLAVLGIALALRRPTRLTWFYLLLIVGGLWLAFGRYGVLYELAYRFLPPFRLVRAPGRAAFLYLFAASALLAHTLSVWRDLPAAERRRLLRPYWPAAVGVPAVALVAALAATGAVFMAVHPTDTSGRLWQQIGGYTQALIVVGLGGALIWAYLNYELGIRNYELRDGDGEWRVAGGAPTADHRPTTTDASPASEDANSADATHHPRSAHPQMRPAAPTNDQRPTTMPDAPLATRHAPPANPSASEDADSANATRHPPPATLNSSLVTRNSSLLLALALIILVLADTWHYAHKMVRLTSSAPDAVWVDGLAVVGEPTGRVVPWGVPLFSQNGAIAVGWPSVFGYDSLEPAATMTLAASVPDPRSTAYDILGATHVLAGGPLDEFTEGERPLRLLGQQGAAWVYERARPLPLARLVYGVEVIADPAAAVARVHEADFDAAATAIVAADPGCAVGPAPATVGTAEIVTRAATQWQIRTRSEAAGLLVVAENAFPGWQVTIDGQPAEALTAYTAVRAVCVPAGEHEVAWTFRPRAYLLGAGVTLLALVLLLWAARRAHAKTQRTPS